MGGNWYRPLGYVSYHPGIFSGVRGSAPSSHYVSKSVFDKPQTDSSFQRGSAGASGVKDSRASDKGRLPGFLQSILPCSQTIGEMEGDFRPFSPELDFEKGKIQDGKPGVDQETDGGHEMGHISGSETRVLSCASSQESQEVSEICNQWSNSTVQSPTNGPSILAMGLHPGDKASLACSTGSGDTSGSVFGRLVGHKPESSPVTGSHQQSGRIDRTVGVLDKPDKVRTESVTTDRVSGNDVGSGKSDSGSHTESLRPLSEKAGQSVERTRGSSKTLGKDGGNLQVYVESTDNGGGTSQAVTVVPKRQMAPEVHAKVASDNTGKTDHSPDKVVVPEGESNQSSTLSISSSPAIGVHGCVDRGLGGTSTVTGSVPGVVGVVVSIREDPPHKSVRTESGRNDIVGGAQVVGKQISHDSIRQHHSDCLPKQAGGYQIKESQYRIPKVVTVDKKSGDTCQSTSHSRKTECDRGHVVSEKTSTSHRVGPTRVSFSPHLSQMGDTQSGLVRNGSKCKASSVRISRAGSTGSRSRCPKHKLGGDVCLCVPPNGPSGTSVGENQTGQVSNSIGSPLLAGAKLVSTVKGVGKRKTTTVATGALSNKAASVGHIPQLPGKAKSSRVALISQKLSEKFHTTVADAMADPHRSSSSSLYDSRWDAFVEWSVVQNIHSPTKATESQVADFLMHLHGKGYKLSTLKGYLTAISKVIVCYTGVEVSRSKDLSALLASISKNQVVDVHKVPEWDLSVVLKALKSAPFEPLETCDLRFLTYKTVFLVALASGGRRSEIHALTLKGLTHGVKHEWVIIYPDVSFMRKNQTLRDGAAGVNPIRIEALPGDSDGGVQLCPVRSLMVYMDRVAPQRGDRRRLFIPIPEKVERPLHVHTISSWMKKCIELAYHHAGKVVAGKATGHDVRKYAVSWAYRNQVSVGNLLRVCKWKSPNAFIKYYLKDCLAIREGMYTLGPIVSAGQIV